MIVGCLAALGMMLAGCTKDNPLAPPDQAVSKTAGVSGQQIQMLKLPGTPSLGKIYTASSLITAKDGGKLVLDCKDRAGAGENFSVHIELRFEPGTITDDFVATLTMDSYYLMSTVDMQFGPHGSTFLKPAILSANVVGVDLTGFTKDAPPNLYYDDNGTWVPMQGEVKIDPKHLKLECKDGELPHFSRYCFGR